MKKVCCLLISVLLLLFITGITASAEISTNDLPYDSYTYRLGTDTLLVPTPYNCTKTFEATDLGISNFNSMSDIFYDGNRIYLCDSGNNRIVILDSQMKLVSIIEEFDNKGKLDKLNSPSGVFVTDNTIFIADTLNSRIVEFDAKTFALKKILGKPEISILEADYNYNPLKVTVDAAGRVYVIASGINRGLIELDENGKFSTFLGAPSVVPDFFENIWRRFANKTQRDKLDQYVPTEYDALTIDNYGFIYAVAKNTENTAFVKLNSQGTDVLRFSDYFGDENYATPNGSVLSPYFVDVAVSNDEFYYLLDSQQGKVYVYTPEGKILYAFGTNGSQQGTFYSASALEIINDSVYVVDSAKNTINVFELTDFGSLVMKSVRSQNAGKYEDARKYWTEVQSKCSHYPMATISLAKLDVMDGNYRESLDELKAIGAIDEYNEAFTKSRDAFLRDNMLWFIIGVIAVVALLVWAVKLIKKTKVYNKISSTKLYKEYKYGTYTMSHPFDGFWDIKRENRGSLGGALITLALFVVCYAVRSQFSGYLVVEAQSSQINAFYECFKILLPLVLFAVTNWCFTTLMDGEGTMKDIVIFTCYSLKPYIVLSIPMFIFSQVLTLDEILIYNIVDIFTLIWIIFLLFIGMMMTHDYSLIKTVLTTICTLIGICLMLFIILLVINIVQDVVDFATSLYNEITFRAY